MQLKATHGSQSEVHHLYRDREICPGVSDDVLAGDGWDSWARCDSLEEDFRGQAANIVLLHQQFLCPQFQPADGGTSQSMDNVSSLLRLPLKGTASPAEIKCSPSSSSSNDTRPVLKCKGCPMHPAPWGKHVCCRSHDFSNCAFWAWPLPPTILNLAPPNVFLLSIPVPPAKEKDQCERVTLSI